MPAAILESKYKGKKYGRLTVVAKTKIKNSSNATMWLFHCDCGNKKYLSRIHSVLSNYTKSCGCMNAERAATMGTKHDKHKEKLYSVWSRIKSRCYIKGNIGYARYGGRGIKLFDLWKNNYTEFREYVVNLPNFPKLMINNHKKGDPRIEITLDRIDNDGNYEPGNLKWSTWTEQARNRKNSRYIIFSGQRRLLIELCESLGLNYGTVLKRLGKNWSSYKAITFKNKEFSIWQSPIVKFGLLVIMLNMQQKLKLKYMKGP